jgi:dTDP-4-amino-4,6-dideoxygalactose transaminase
MTKRHFLAEKTINDQDIRDLVEWLKTDPWLTQGSLVQQFESQRARWLGVKYATFVNSGSS